MIDVPATDQEILQPAQVPELPEDTLFLGDKLHDLTLLTEKVYQALVRQETPAPSQFFCMPGIRNDFPQAPRVRVSKFIFSVSAAATVSVKIGTATELQFDLPGADTRELTWLQTIDAGADVAVTASAGVLRHASFIGYAEALPPV